MIARRTLIAGAALAPALTLLGRASLAAPAAAALKTSKLVYLTPLASNGEESRCKAEIWFAYAQGDIFVVTPADAWRAQAVRRGLTRTRLWVGEFGVWTAADSAFRQAPELLAAAALETDAEVQAHILDALGDKYAADGWRAWGPRFRNGLADGSRVMIRYRIDP